MREENKKNRFHDLPQTEEKKQDSQEQQTGYSGFLYIRCGHCGETRGFHAKYPTTYYKCNQCGEKTDFENMSLLWVNCECGKNYRYLTNQTDEAFDINCLECGNPVAVQWNDKKKIYETIREKRNY